MTAIALRSALSAGACALAIMATGCALQPLATDTPLAVKRFAVSAFELSGRMSASDSERAASGRIEWRHQPLRDEWTVFSPLGQIMGQLVSTPDGAVLHTADGARVDAPSAQHMIPELLGIDVPVDGLTHWVQAVPRPGARVLGTDAAGRPARVSDAGWVIDYNAYAGSEPDAPPRRIDAHRGDKQIRLIIDEWLPSP